MGASHERQRRLVHRRIAAANDHGKIPKAAIPMELSAEAQGGLAPGSFCGAAGFRGKVHRAQALDAGSPASKVGILRRGEHGGGTEAAHLRPLAIAPGRS